MSRDLPQGTRLPILTIVAATAFMIGGCVFEHDPATSVNIEITGVSATDYEEIQETLKGMTDGSSHYITSMRIGDTMTVQLSPVSDVEAFSRKINFGEVTEVKDRTVKVTFVK